MLLGESRAALVQSMEELTGMVKVNESKVLMVDCEVEDCTKDVPHLWRRIQLTREAGGSLLVDGKEFLEKGVSCAMQASKPAMHSVHCLLSFLLSSAISTIAIISTNEQHQCESDFVNIGLTLLMISSL